MAKDGTNRGGARIGAGQKKKPLADKILEGNPGRRKLMVMEFTDAAELEGESMPPPRDYLAAKQKNGKTTLAVEIYEKTWQWLKERRCVHLIPAQLIEQYAQSVARWIQCEECITEFGFLAKHPTTGNAIPVALCGYESKLYETGQQPVVSDLSSRAGKLCYRIQGGHSPRRCDGKTTDSQEGWLMHKTNSIFLQGTKKI
jgi:hypothetical protein